MKSIISVLLMSFFLNTYGQNTYNNYIDTLGTLNMYGKGKVAIGKIIITELGRSKLYLKSVSQTKDSTTNIYTTIFNLVSPNIEKNLPVLGIDLKLEFDKPILNITTVNGSWTGRLETNYSNKMKWHLQAPSVSILDHLEIVVRSQDAIQTNVYGIDGLYK